MNGADTVTLTSGDEPVRVRFLGTGAAADLPPFVGEFEITEPDADDAEPRTVQVAADVQFLWSADVAMDADEAAERIMRTVGLLAVERHVKGDLETDRRGMVRLSDFIGRRFPDRTSVERFVGSLYDPPGRIARWCREDVLRCLAEHAEAAGDDEAPTGPGLTVGGIRAWPGKRRLYDAETIRDALVRLENDGLLDRPDDRARIHPDRVDDARAMLG